MNRRARGCRHENDLPPLHHVAVDGLAARRAHIDDALFVALTDDADAVVVDVCQVQADQLGAADATVQNSIRIAKSRVWFRPVDRAEQRRRFFKRQVFR